MGMPNITRQKNTSTVSGGLMVGRVAFYDAGTEA